MRNIWEFFERNLQDIQNMIQDEELMNWSGLLDLNSSWETFLSLLPKDVGYKLLYNLSKEPNGHLLQKHIDTMFSEGKQVRWIVGTLDASKDDMFKELYETFGWRTVFFLRIHQRHVASYGDNRLKNQAILWDSPCVLFSAKPDKLSKSNFKQTIAAVLLLFSSMLLRLGLNWYANRSERLWATIPGALLLITREKAYEINDRCREWFGIDTPQSEGIPLSDFLPSDLVIWLKNLISDKKEYDPDQAARTIWLTRHNGQLMRAIAMVRPYRPFENINVDKRLTTGYSGISLDQANKKLHLLSIRDVTAQWEAEKLQQEIDLARRMQRSLQPKKIPDTNIFDIAAACHPANHVGGDLYDIVSLPDGRLAMILGDAAGHGVDSALLASLVSGAFRASVTHDSSPEKVLSSVDQVLRATPQQSFVTAVYLLFENDGHLLTYGLAGHHAPMICRCQENRCDAILPSSLPLGITLPPSYHIRRELLNPGDIVSVFSDGLIETQNENGETFERFVPEILKKNRDRTAENVLKAVLNSVHTFRGSAAQNDDVTAMVVKVNKQ
ncbi:PP2C family protein-serine/threonine phosphatase [bacterium]|nr:PP2C family protein-serine/threonine phosphatase [candidate division CSSED10-310 bacterium]